MNILKMIYDGGVVGAGGAGFPAHKKLGRSVEYFIVNGAECEPLLKTDQFVMSAFGEEIVKAAELAAERVSAKYACIALKRKYAASAESLNSAINRSGSNIKLFMLESIYPAGDEQVLVHEVTGRTVKPGGIPLSVGAVVSNASTLYNIYEAVCGKPVIDKYITVTGEVNRPAVIKAPIGTPVMECIAAAGGPTMSDYSAIMGGPMMGKILSREQLKDRVVTKTDGGIIVIPKDHYLALHNALTIEHMVNQAKSACIQCRYCTDMCPRYLLGHNLKPHKIMRAMSKGGEDESLLSQALLCSECGVCEMYACPMGLSPKRINMYVKDILRQKGIKPYDAEICPDRQVMRGYRQIPASRIVSRLNVDKYDMHLKPMPVEVLPGRVSIPLKQHVGAPAVPVVSVGDYVEKGRLIGTVNYMEMGANVHASIAGRVAEISGSIVIEGEGWGVD